MPRHLFYGSADGFLYMEGIGSGKLVLDRKKICRVSVNGNTVSIERRLPLGLSTDVPSK